MLLRWGAPRLRVQVVNRNVGTTYGGETKGGEGKRRVGKGWGWDSDGRVDYVG